MKRNEMYLRIRELKNQIKSKEKSYHQDMYDMLSELYHLEKKLDSKFTYRKLSIQNGLEEQWTYKLMSWRRATIYVKTQVEKDKITMITACRMISKVPVLRQNEAIAYTIKKKLTCREVDKYVKKFKTYKQKIIEERDYIAKWNIVRDIFHYNMKIRRCLLAVKNIPRNQRAKVYDALIDLRDAINKAIDIVKPTINNKK